MKNVYVGKAEIDREKGEIKVWVTETSQPVKDDYRVVILNDENKLENKELFMAAIMILQGKKQGLIGPIPTKII